jgi:sulfite reductase (ferredoxin)
MQSFRTELENPVVERDIVDLERKIRLFREGKIDEEKFRSLRLARGVYGQRQQGVQMVRIKLPFGKITTKQLLKIADVSDEYATGNLHLTTRQDIQIHYVSLDRTPELWAKLEQDDITLREACGNTVRNVTASSAAGIDPDEPFDVSPYADAVFRYFLRNPICQEMGRKFKIAFSSSEKDTALTCMHDLGFIPKLRIENGQTVRGFKVMIGGGLGAQPYLAKVANEFLHEDLIIPYTESVLRVFDRYGERTSRHKARLKFLINNIGMDELTRLIQEETKALKNHTLAIDRDAIPLPTIPTETISDQRFPVRDQEKYERWRKTNTFEQRQQNYFAVTLKITTGDLSTSKARLLAEIVKSFAADELRITITQNLMMKFVKRENLPALFSAIDDLGLAEPGADGIADITTCPGTDTCNLGISSSMGITRELERMLADEYPDFVIESGIKIKISGCMNACAQHGIADIGFHGSSLKAGTSVVPALQVMIGGGPLGDGEGRVADKVTKIPSKRGPQALRLLLNDYADNREEGEYFGGYYLRKGEKHFYTLLKPLADLKTLTDADFIDWEQEVKFETAIGVGECAGVKIDLIATLLFESQEKLSWSSEMLEKGHYADSIYHSYNVFVSTAKALLLDKGVACNTQISIINDFDKNFVSDGTFSFSTEFRTHVLKLNQHEPTKEFAQVYHLEAASFLTQAQAWRENQKSQETRLIPDPVSDLAANLQK